MLFKCLYLIRTHAQQTRQENINHTIMTDENDVKLANGKEEIHDYDDIKFKGNTKKRYRIILLVVLFIGCAAALAIGLSLHYTLNDDDDDGGTTSPPKLTATRAGALVDCYPDPGADEASCVSRGCSWAEPAEHGAPWCSYSASNTGYDVTKNESLPNGGSGERIHLTRRAGIQHVYGMAIHEEMILDIEFYTESAVRLKFYPKTGSFYEVPQEALEMTPTPTVDTTKMAYSIELTHVPFDLKIIRQSSNNTIVFHVTSAGLIFSDQYNQLTTLLPSDHVYGFGEHNHRQFHHNMDWKTWAIFTRDCGPIDAWNLYGAQPTYMNLETDGQANMVFLKNSNAMEVALQPKPYPAVTYRVIGGILDFYVFLAPTPENAVQQYTKAIGRPMMPPYWALGFHLCRWHYGNLTVVKETVRRNQLAGIPQDAQWGDIDHMFEKLDFTVDKATYSGLDVFVDQLHQQGMKYVVINDPGIGNEPDKVQRAAINSPGYNMYADGLTSDVYVKDSNGNVLEGMVWPGRVAYPDFTNEANTLPWFTKWIKYFRDTEGIEIDGLWVDMNEVSSFVPGMYLPDGTTGCETNEWNNPPYAPNILGRDENRRMYDKTICMDAQQHWGRHYDVHSLYGHSMSMLTHKAMKSVTGKRPFVMTRSNFVGTSKWSAHWLGDNQSKWPHLAWSIVGLLEYSIFGFPLNGADICGFWGQAEYEMCLRWHQLGAFYPFSRNHNAHNDAGKPEFTAQDPAAWDAQLIRTSKEALLIRYKLLPFLYTLMHKAHVDGSTVARPLMFEFPKDNKTYTVDKQFLWGSALLISPVLEKDARTVRAYFPKARWFDYYTGTEVSDTSSTEVSDTPGWHDLDAPLDKINLHLRGGHIIPWQYPANNTEYSRRNPLGLMVVLDENHTAAGTLFWDDGESIDTFQSGKYIEVRFAMPHAGKLTLTVVHNDYPAAAAVLQFTTLELYGIHRLPSNMQVDGVAVDGAKVHTLDQIIRIDDLSMSIATDHTVTWDIF